METGANNDAKLEAWHVYHFLVQWTVAIGGARITDEQTGRYCRGTQKM